MNDFIFQKARRISFLLRFPQGDGADECFCVRRGEMRRCAQLMEIRSHCCLTAGTFAVIARVINLRDERRQVLAACDANAAALKNRGDE